MAWKFDNPLYTLTDEQENERAKQLWDSEPLGGITEDNNRLPVPVVGLLALTIITAFMITFPLWGHRPTAAIYEPYLELMDTPEIQALPNDEERMKRMENIVFSDKKYADLIPHLERHPVEMDDLRMIKPQVLELKRQGEPLDWYFVVGNKVVLANFEGNLLPDGRRERKQPWWDIGYTIDVFYILAFCLGVMIAVKRLPPYTWQPTHNGH